MDDFGSVVYKEVNLTMMEADCPHPWLSDQPSEGSSPWATRGTKPEKAVKDPHVHPHSQQTEGC